MLFGMLADDADGCRAASRDPRSNDDANDGMVGLRPRLEVSVYHDQPWVTGHFPSWRSGASL